MSAVTKLEKAMKYKIIRLNDRPYGDYDVWLYKYVEGDYVARHGVAATKEEAYDKASGIDLGPESSRVSIKFDEENSW